MFLKVIACEIAARELYYIAARSSSLVDLELLPQGYHDTPNRGREEVQKRIAATPAGKYDAIVLGYGLCGGILTGLTTAHTPLVVPRAHDCITFFLGSKERYQRCFAERPGTYYYTSGWLEYVKRRGDQGAVWGGASLPAGAHQGLGNAYEEWARKYGEDQAQYLVEEMGRWAQSYSHGTLIDFEFARPLKLDAQVRRICAEKGWQYDEIAGELGLLEAMLEGRWDESAFLVVRPGQKIVATYDERVIGAVDANKRSG
jgi:hypothetical protein